MAAAEWLLPAGVLAGAALIVVRLLQSRSDVARREKTRADYEGNERARERAHVLRSIDRYFPFLREAVRDGLGEGVDPGEAYREAIEGIPAIGIGRTFEGLPAVLPLSERQKHLYVVGKTGSGKTSLLLHLIRDDLRAGRGVGVFAPEAELFRDSILPLVPRGRAEAGDVIYFAPGRTENPLTWNPLELEPGDDRSRAAEEFFSIVKRAVAEESMGVRMAPILGNAFAALVGREGATLTDVQRLLVDEAFRVSVAGGLSDEYLRTFWRETYPSYPKGSHLPVVNRLDQFLRPVPVRRAITAKRSSFSIREALAKEKILLVDLSGLAPESRLLLGQMLLAKFELELHRREGIPQEERKPFHLFADEFQTFAGVAEGTWRELLSRGRRYGLALTLAHQYPAQLPPALQDEIFGNVASIVAFALGAKDAQAIRREFLVDPGDGGAAESVALESLVSSRPGQAIARIGSGAFSIPLQAPEPLPPGDPKWGEEVRVRSWARYGAKASGPAAYQGERPPQNGAPSPPAPRAAPRNGPATVTRPRTRRIP